MKARPILEWKLLSFCFFYMMFSTSLRFEAPTTFLDYFGLGLLVISWFQVREMYFAPLHCDSEK